MSTAVFRLLLAIGLLITMLALFEGGWLLLYGRLAPWS